MRLFVVHGTASKDSIRGRFTQLRNNLIDRSIGNFLSVVFNHKNNDERTLPTPLPEGKIGDLSHDSSRKDTN